MAIYRKKGFAFTKNFVIPNNEKNKIIFGFQVSIGINADEPQYFNQTANWIFIGGGFNLKETQRIPGLFYRWNVKRLENLK